MALRARILPGSASSQLELHSLSVQTIAAHIEYPVESSTIVFERGIRSQFHELFHGKVAAQLGVKRILTFDGVSAIASASPKRAASGAGNPSYWPSRIAETSSSVKPYILPPAELASIQNGQPTRTAVRNVTSARSRGGIFAFWSKSHIPRVLNQNRRGTRAWIFCGVRSRPTILRTLLNTWRIRKGARLGSIPSIRAMLNASLSIILKYGVGSKRIKVLIGGA